MSARGSTPAEGESQNLDQPRAVRPRASPGKARYHVGSGLQVGTGIPRRRSGTGTHRAAGTVPRGREEQNPPPLPANSPDSPPPRPVASQCVILSLTFVKWNQTASAARPLSLRSPESSLPSRAAWLRAMRTVSPLPAPLCLPPARLSHSWLVSWVRTAAGHRAEPFPHAGARWCWACTCVCKGVGGSWSQRVSVLGDPTEETPRFTLTAGCEFPWVHALSDTRCAQGVRFSSVVCAWWGLPGMPLASSWEGLTFSCTSSQFALFPGSCLIKSHGHVFWRVVCILIKLW